MTMSFLPIERSSIIKGISVPAVVFGVFLACLSGYLFRWTLHVLIHRLGGLFLGIALTVSIYSLGIFYKPFSRWSTEFDSIDSNPLQSLPPFAFLDPDCFIREKLELKPGKDELKKPIYPESFIISESLDVIIELVIRDFLLAWYNRLSKDDGYFPLSVESLIRHVMKELKGRLVKIDMADFLIGRIIPLVDSHFTQFNKADLTVRSKASKNNLTQTNELYITVAREFNGGKLHPAVALKQSNLVGYRKKWLSEVVSKLVPHLLPESERGSLIVVKLLREIITNNILLPMLDPFCNQDTWNQLIVKVALPTMQDRKQVHRLLAALDEHASIAGKPREVNSIPTNKRTLKLAPNADQATFDRFIRQIKKTQSLADARQIRYYISVQSKRAVNESLNQQYINYLQQANEVINDHISKVLSKSSFSDTITSSNSGHSTNLKLQDLGDVFSLDDILENPSCLQSFMEFVDQRNHTVVLQFILTVKAIKDPLETVNINRKIKLHSSTSNPLMSTSNEVYTKNKNISNLTTDKNDFSSTNNNDGVVDYGISDDYDSTDDDNDDDKDNELFSIDKNQNDQTNRDEIAAIYHSYFLNQSQPIISERSLNTVETYLNADVPLNSLYRKARRVILKTQLRAIKFLQESDLVEFKKSDLYLKYKASAGNQSGQWPKQYKPLHDNKIDTQANFHSPFENSTFVSGKMASHSLVFNSKAVKTLRTLAGSPVSAEEEGGRKIHVSQQKQPDEQTFEAVEAVFKDIMHQPSEDISNIAEECSSIGPVQDTRYSSTSSYPETNCLPVSGKANKLFDSSDDEFESDLEGTSVNRDKTFVGNFRFSSSDTLKSFKSVDNYLANQVLSGDEDDIYDLHHASPGDLGLAEVIDSLNDDIERLYEKETVLASLLRKAELTNNTIELRILRKSKSSLDREIHRKELQRQQYIVQKNDNGLFGRSNISIQGYVNGSENGNEYTLYIIQVQRFNIDGSISAGWVVARRYKQFLRLHQHLKSLFPSINNLNFPKKNLIVKLQVKSFINERKDALETYLKRLLEIPQVCNSKAFRAFLSSETFSLSKSGGGIIDNDYEDDDEECIYKSEVPSAINRSKSLTQDFFSRQYSVMAGDSNQRSQQDRVPTDLHFLNDIGSSISSDSGLSSKCEPNLSEIEAEINSVETVDSSIDMVSKDQPFIQPICEIFIKLFALDKGHGWLRGRAVVVVIQQLLGGTIERKIRDLAASLTTEKKLLEIIQKLQNSLWPDGIFKQFNPNISSPVVRTNSDIAKTRREANLLFESLVIELCSRVVGGSKARYAANRLFSMLQNPLLDTQLTYSIFEEVISTLFPEIKEI